jgi:hypothetical protein
MVVQPASEGALLVVDRATEERCEEPSGTADDRRVDLGCDLRAHHGGEDVLRRVREDDGPRHDGLVGHRETLALLPDHDDRTVEIGTERR